MWFSFSQNHITLASLIKTLIMMKGGATSFAILLLFSSASKSSSFLIISPHTTRWTSNRSKTHDVRSSENENENTESIEDANRSVIGRRELLRGILLVSAAFKSIATRADDLSLLSPTVTSQKPAICDPTVESYRKGSHQIHIVGTAHISSESSRLSKEAVRQSKVKLILYMKSFLSEKFSLVHT